MKDIISTLEKVEEQIDSLTYEGIYEIERDLLLERLRNLYSKVLTSEPKSEEIGGLDAFFAMQTLEEVEEQSEEPAEEVATEDVVEEEPAAEEVAEEEPAVPEEEEVCEEPATPENEPEEAAKEAENAEVVEEEEVVLVEEPVAEEEPEEEPVAEEELIEEEREEVVAPKAVGEIDHQAAMSLYDDDDDEEDEMAMIADEEPALDEEPEEEIAEVAEEVQTIGDAEGGQVLAEVLAAEQVTVAESLAEQAVDDVATAATASLSLRQAIGVNDKFILMRDLFAGNSDYYAEAIDKLDSFENLDEAMLYIYDNFHWNPNSEGARLLMELLARKLF